MADDITKLIKEEAEETRRHFDVVVEDLDSKLDAVGEQLDTVAEQVAGNTVAITKVQETLESHGAKLDAIEGTLGVMQQDISFIKNELKQKVDRDEFAALEQRVGQLETRQKV